MEIYFTSQAQQALNYAKEAAKACKNNYVGTEHLLLGILRIKQAQLSQILKEYEVDYDCFFEDVTRLFGFSASQEGPLEYTCTMDDILQRCFFLSRENDNQLIDLDCLSLCLLEAKNNVANELLRRKEIEIEEVIDKLRYTQMTLLKRFKELRNINESQIKNPTRIAGREKELSAMMDTLLRKVKANPLLVGEAGVGKTALVEELARRIVCHEVPKALEDCVIFELSLNSLVAGTKYRGEFEEKIQKLLDTVKMMPKVILFIDEIHMMINAGKAEGSIDVAGVLKPYLARGLLRCIGATTLDEYSHSIEKDRALRRRFQLIRIDEPTYEQTRNMLMIKKREYEQHHGVVFPEKLVDSCLDLSRRYLPSMTFPDKAIDLMDLSCVKAKMNHKKTVSENVLLQAAESLCQVPLSLKKIFLLQKEKVSTFLTEEQIHLMTQRLEQIDQRKMTGPMDVWTLQGQSREKLAQTLAEIFLKEKSRLIVLEPFMRWDEILTMFYERLKKQPFQMIYLEKELFLSKNENNWIHEILEKGEIYIADRRVDFRFCLFLVGQKETMRSVGFNPRLRLDSSEEFVLKLPAPAL